MRRASLLAWLMTMVCSSGWAKPTVGLCAASDTMERQAVASLSAWVRMGRVQAACDGAYQGRFVADGARVRFELVAPGGVVLARGVPWIDDAERPLSRLAMADRLGAFAVLLDALIVEDRVGAAGPLRAKKASPTLVRIRPTVPPAAKAVPPPVWAHASRHWT